MVAVSPRVYLDPWPAEYESALGLGESDEAPPPVDLSVETQRWAPVRPSPDWAPEAIVFVDGVRRAEQRLFVEDAEGATHPGLLGSFAVGAAESARGGRILDCLVDRLSCLAGGRSAPPVEAAVGAGKLFFRPETAPEDAPGAPLQALQTAMRRAEAALARRLAGAPGRLVLLDGPLGYLEPADEPVLGYVKRLLRDYLDPEAARLLPRLAVGERTPLFLIKGAREARYSFYLRVGPGGPADHPLAGVVRVETSARRPLEEVRAAADAATTVLPRFASDPVRDARAPQNLYPVGALESRLQHLLGDAELIRRAIRSALHSRGPEAAA
jgi:hypothetical protein